MLHSRWALLLCTTGMLPATGHASEPCASLFVKLDTEHTRVIRSAPVQRKQFAALETELFQALERCPAEADLQALMGEVQISLGQVSLAAAYGRKALELDRRSWRAQQLLGSALAMLGETGRGIAHLERAAALAPENPRVRLNLASALFAAEDYERALRLCNTLIESTDTRVAGAAHNLRGQVFLRRGEISKAGREFDTAMKLGFDPRRQLRDTDKWRRDGKQDRGGPPR